MREGERGCMSRVFDVVYICVYMHVYFEVSVHV